MKLQYSPATLLVCSTTRFTILGLLCLAALLPVCGCAGKAPNVKTPDRLTLYSIKTETTDADEGNGRFHNYPILGKVEIADAGQRREIMTALVEGIAKGGVPGACFWPRHAIQTITDGKTVDYVICFHCSQIEVYGDNPKTEVTTNDAMPVLDRYLKAAAITQVPEPRIDFISLPH